MDWNTIKLWRREQRARLIDQRLAVSREDRQAAREHVNAAVDALLERFDTACVGFYWPFRGEIDLMPVIKSLLARGCSAALPVVVAKGQPLVFRGWTPGAAMVPGVWNIPVPADDAPVVPDVVLSPLVGYDPAGYRLGYGGGFYDRTLAALTPRPWVIGVGYRNQALTTIYPQDHDVPMDVILTDDGRWWERGATADGPASSPCSLDEVDPAYRGF